MILYKYFSDNVHSYQALSINGLWCHHPVNMNDPFECLGYVKRKITPEQITSFREYIENSNNPTLKKIKKLSDQLIEEFINKQRKESIKRFTFCSLSESYDDIKMWSHYASGHTGFVIGIQINESDMDHHFQKVRYVETLPTFDVRLLADYLEGNDKLIGYFFEDISIKSKVWETEREYRIWRAKPGYYRYEIQNIKEVYFGINTKPETKMIVAKLLGDLGKEFKYYEMEFGYEPIRLRY